MGKSGSQFRNGKGRTSKIAQDLADHFEGEESKDSGIYVNGQPFTPGQENQPSRSQRGDFTGGNNGRTPNPIDVAVRAARQITDRDPDREQPDELMELLKQLDGMKAGQRIATLQRLCGGILENSRDDEGGFGKVQPAHAVARALNNDPETNRTPDGKYPRRYDGEVHAAAWLQELIYDEANPLQLEDLPFMRLAEPIPDTTHFKYYLKERALSGAARKLRFVLDPKRSLEEGEEALGEEEQAYIEDLHSVLSDEERAHLQTVAEWLPGVLQARAERIAGFRAANRQAQIARQAREQEQKRYDDRKAFVNRLPVRAKRTEVAELLPIEDDGAETPATAPLDDEVENPQA